MKKINFLLAFLLFFSAFTMNAQTPFSKGDKVVNIGIGLGTFGVTGSTSIPPISASLDYGVKDNLFDEKSSLSVGGYTGYYSSKSSFTSGSHNYGYKYSYFILGGRAAVHYDFIKKLDTYAGLMLGYNIVKSKYYGHEFSGSPKAENIGGFTYSGYIGARYYFNQKFAAFLELGYGVSAAEIGVAIKL